jgi:hypothetical protein
MAIIRTNEPPGSPRMPLIVQLLYRYFNFSPKIFGFLSILKIGRFIRAE